MTRLSGNHGFLGFGNMGSAILAGLLEKQVLHADQAMVYDPDSARMEAARELGVACAPTPAALAAACDVVILAVKPQALNEALAPVTSATRPDVRVISIMAGISIAALRARFDESARIIRVMPNTPALVGAGAAALAHSDNCSERDISEASAIFEAVGIVEVVPESFMDAVTALSGSGPAYFFQLTECLVAAAVAEGLPEPVAERLATHTLLGAGKLLVSTGRPPGVLREQVTSKGGTTFAALETLRAGDFAGLVQSAYHAAAVRSRELGMQNK